jgi:ppGpp synthetase/RelA/SpoT-type nucleotidyltranferase
MARTKRSIAERFLKQFERDKPLYDQGSIQAIALINEILVNSPAVIHAVTARPKELSSLRLKLAEKGYSRPKRQVSDLIAARVITYYRDAVPIVVNALSTALEIDKKRSLDKREELEAVEFGYSSVHLIVRTRGGWSTSPQYFALRDRWFEIQIRSLLEHAWAENEHEVVYKSGIEYPAAVKRRFARIAGAIEIIEDEFIELREHRQKLIDQYSARYQSGLDGALEIDSARLIALLECERPDCPGWRAADRDGRPYPAHIDNRCAKALKRVGIRTGKSLQAILRSRELKAAEALFAREHRLSEPLSHLNTARLAVLLNGPVIFSDYFPELLTDIAIQGLLRQRRSRRGR